VFSIAPAHNVVAQANVMLLTTEAQRAQSYFYLCILCASVVSKNGFSIMLQLRHIARPFILTLLLICLLLPFAPLLIWSFAFRWAWPDLLPSAWSLRQWIYIASPESKVGEALMTSIALASVATACALLVGIPAGRALGMHQFHGKRLVELLILAPVIVPALAVSLGIHILFIRYGLTDTFVGVVLVHLIPTVPYVTLVMASVFANFDRQYEEQARILGAGPVHAFVLVTLPAVYPGLVVAGLFAFLISWSQYLLTLLIGGGNLITLPLLLFAFARSGDNGIASALALVFIAPAVVILLLTAKYLSGETLRGVTR
jgi:putative spermidine/putrescine transport system permease protein